MLGGQQHFEAQVDRAVGAREEVRAAGQRLLLLRVENMQDEPDQERMRGAVPVVADAVAVRVDEDIGDVLRVAHFLIAHPDLEQRVVPRARAVRARGIELETEAAELATPPARREHPVLSLHVVDEHRVRPGEQVRHDERDAFAAPSRGEDEDVLGTIVTEGPPFPSGPLAQDEALLGEEPGIPRLSFRGPPGGAVEVGLQIEALDGHDDDDGCNDSAGRRRHAERQKGRAPELVRRGGRAQPLCPREEMERREEWPK